jgi:hypothetical protein
MDARVRERQTERSWLAHQPERARIPPEAWRCLRRFKASIAADAVRIMAASAETEALRALLLAVFRKGTLAKQKARAIERLREYVAPAVLTFIDGAATWSWAEPRGTIIISDHPADKQDCIVMHYGHATAAPRHDLSAYASASVEVPDHGLGRMLQRRPGADIGAALQQAHAAFLAADRAIIAGHLKARTTFHLPAGEGVLICRGMRGVDPRGRGALFARAHTWISNSMRRADQHPVAAAAAVDAAQLGEMTMLALKARQR